MISNKILNKLRNLKKNKGIDRIEHYWTKSVKKL